MKKSELNDKLKCYSSDARDSRRRAKVLAGAMLTAGAACAGLPEAGAAIHYTDVNPDITVGAANINFNVTMGGGRRHFIRYYPASNSLAINNAATSANAQMANATGGARYFAAGANIGATGILWTGWYQPLCHGGTGPGGNFLNKDGYIGVRFSAAPNRNYGWIRLQGAANGLSGIVKGFAYQDVVNTSIRAGEAQ